MTAGLKPPPFATTPELVADATRRGADRARHTVWVPGALRYVFAVLRHLPRRDLPEAAVVRRNPLLVDVAIAVALTVLVLIVVPGLAVVAILAVIVVLVCGASFVVAALRRRRARPPRSRLPTPSRPPRRPMPRR